MGSMLEDIYNRRPPLMSNNNSGSNGGGYGDMNNNNNTNSSSSSSNWAQGKSEVDELLANAGYNVRASELPQLAQQIEVLDSLMGTAPELLQETVHYNPTDMAGWIECMLNELGPGPMLPSVPPSPPPPPPPPSASAAAAANHNNPNNNNSSSSSVRPADSSSELESGVTSSGVQRVDQPLQSRTLDNLQQQQQQQHEQIHQQQLLQRPPSSLMQMPVAAAQADEEAGVRLVHLLLACANAAQSADMAAASELTSELRALLADGAAAASGAMGRVAAYFADGLSRRLLAAGAAAPPPVAPLAGGDLLGAGAVDEILHFHFYETCPYLKFAHFTANQAILEAFENHSHVHVIDFNLGYGLQWPALIQALALRPGGPPLLRLTGIGPPQPGGHDLLREIGMKLAQLAESVRVEFAFNGVVADRLDRVQPWVARRPGEAVAVNSVFQLHKLLLDAEGGDGAGNLSGAANVAPGGAASLPACPSGGAADSPATEVLRWVRSLNPVVVTLVEQDAEHNGAAFLDRFMAALHYYSTMFDSLEACHVAPGSLEQLVAEAYLGREVVDIVGGEGAARLERHECLAKWRVRMSAAGFAPLYLGSNAFRQASMLLNLFSGDGYRVEENGGCLTLGWHSRSLVAASAWR